MIPAKTKTIVFIHGLFVNPKSWNEWKAYFEAKDYTCFAPANPCHEGDPAQLRTHINPKLADVTFIDVVENMANFIDTLLKKPIIIGHSMAGLVVQKLISMDKAVAGVCIDGAAPVGVITTKWSFWKSNFPVINPLKGNSIFVPNKEGFHYTFCNLKKPHNPLLFIAGEKDHIVPVALDKSNFNAYTDLNSVKEFKEFSDRGHYICGEKNWQEIGAYVLNWIKNY